MRVLVAILFCWLVSFSSMGSAAHAQSATTPDMLHAVSRALLEEKSVSQEPLLEQFAEQYQDDVRGVLARLVLGYYAYQEEQYPKAKLHFEAAHVPRTPLQDYAEYYLALTEVAEKNHDAAAGLLDGFAERYPESALNVPATLQWAESLLELSRPAGVITRFSSPPSFLAIPEANVLLAEAYMQEKEFAQAARAYQDVYYQFPTSEQASEAEKQLGQLRTQLKKNFPEPSLEMSKKRAERLFARGWWRSARREYQALAARSKGAARTSYLLRVGVAQYRGGATWPALSTLGKLKLTEPEEDAERLYTLAALYRRVRREKLIFQQIDLLSKKYPRSPWYENALFLAGNYYLLVPDLERAHRYYRMVYEHFPQGEYAERSHWKVAWWHYRERRLLEAQRLFEEHVRNYPKSSQAAASLYWLGRLAEREFPAQAAAHYRKLVEWFPNFYYGHLGHKRLAALLALPAMTQPETPVPLDKLQESASAASPSGNLPPAAQQHWEKAKLLESVWLVDLALGELQAALARDRSSRFLGRELARLEKERSRHHLALRYAKRFLNGYLTSELAELPREEWELLFPLPWWDEVKKQAEAAKLDPYLVAGLIRQESEFDPQARSHANARGLMQLLPSTARRVARGVPNRSARGYRLSRLYQPEYNLAWGTHYLKNVLDLFEGKLELGLAAYNAGENRVEEWLSEADRNDANFDEPTEFIESIPFTETRGYVQSVLRNAELYRRIYRELDFSATLESDKAAEQVAP